ncbi:hypothetical protein KIS4809_1318 [Bacillus sp. ZZV12-4809]|nr:hypothetical protein KIS4809_1318 [Bacillus sp. ZZV12-4809]
MVNIDKRKHNLSKKSLQKAINSIDKEKDPLGLFLTASSCVPYH